MESSKEDESKRFRLDMTRGQALFFVWDILFDIAVPTTLLALGGRWLDRRLGWQPWFTIAGLLLSLAISALLVRRNVRKLQRKTSDNKLH